MTARDHVAGGPGRHHQGRRAGRGPGRRHPGGQAHARPHPAVPPAAGRLGVRELPHRGRRSSRSRPRSRPSTAPASRWRRSPPARSPPSPSTTCASRPTGPWSSARSPSGRRPAAGPAPTAGRRPRRRLAAASSGVRPLWRRLTPVRSRTVTTGVRPQSAVAAPSERRPASTIHHFAGVARYGPRDAKVGAERDRLGAVHPRRGLGSVLLPPLAPEPQREPAGVTRSRRSGSQLSVLERTAPAADRPGTGAEPPSAGAVPSRSSRLPSVRPAGAGVRCRCRDARRRRRDVLVRARRRRAWPRCVLGLVLGGRRAGAAPRRAADVLLVGYVGAARPHRSSLAAERGVKVRYLPTAPTRARAAPLRARPPLRPAEPDRRAGRADEPPARRAASRSSSRSAATSTRPTRPARSALAACRRVIRAVGQLDPRRAPARPERAAALADEAEAALREAQAALAPFPAVAHAGFLHDAEKEYVEARAHRRARRRRRRCPAPAELGVDATAWLRRAGRGGQRAAPPPARPAARRRPRPRRGAARRDGRRLRRCWSPSTIPTPSPAGCAARSTRCGPCSNAPAATSPPRCCRPACRPPSRAGSPRGARLS